MMEDRERDSAPGPRIVGIVNITGDSFSDGGLYLDPERALAHGRALVEAGADVVELGAAASGPEAGEVPPEEEIRRLRLPLDRLLGEGTAVAVDSFQPAVQRYGAARGVAYLNDIQGFPHPEVYGDLARSRARLVVMHSIQRRGKATRTRADAETVRRRLYEFFEERLRALEAGGIARERLVLDPGMGLFLGANPEPSLLVLRELRELKRAFGLPVLVSVSRKSFLGSVTGRGVRERGAATLAAEIFAARQGVDFIRTHDVAALRDALAVLAALDGLR
jgi:dihydropteroate synthase type 2